MSKFLCVCGETIRTSGEIPHPQQWLFTSDVEYDGRAGQIDAEALYMAFEHAYLCPKSGHLWVFDRGYDNEPRCYAPLARGYAPDANLRPNPS
jgi:hypothetical protein